MPTYDQLDNEAAWLDEYPAPGLKILGEKLRAHWPNAEIGIRGDNAHLRGYHRSRRWIKESDYCTNRTYSVSRTPGDISGGDSNWACALDFGGITQDELHTVCRRLDEAIRAGRLEKITEWYGNFGGDDIVDGFDNISNRMASSDPSHLYHLHMSFDRGRANEDHSDVAAILIGDDMSWSEPLVGDKGKTFPASAWLTGISLVTWDLIWPAIQKIAEKVDIDPAELEQIKASAEAGARAGVLGSVDELVAAFVAALPDDVASRDDVKSALREVLLTGVGAGATQ